MSWGLGWKRPSEIFHLTLSYGNDDPPESLARTSTSSRSSSASSSSSSSSASSIVSQDQDLGFRIELDWSSSEDEDQVALKLQSQLMVALPMPQDTVVIELTPREEDEDAVDLVMKVVKRRDPLRAITMAKAVNSGQQTDGTGVLTRLLRSDLVSTAPEVVDAGVPGSGGGHHWTSLAVLSICGCGLSVSFIFSLFNASSSSSFDVHFIVALVGAVSYDMILCNLCVFNFISM